LHHEEEAGVLISLAKGTTTTGLNLAVTYKFTPIGFNNNVKSISNAQSLAETVALTFAY
jgi:hypothetical protein